MGVLTDRTAVVTGAGRGIGRAISLAFAREGARVGLMARSHDELERVAEEIRAAGGTAVAIAGDVSDREAVERSFRQVEEALGPVDLLVNNAASFYAIGPVWEVDAERWWRDVTINVLGVFLCCRTALRSMVPRKVGRIVNLIGGGTGNPFAYGSGYASSKAAVMRLTECLHQELQEQGLPIAVFAMGPGLVRTTLTEFQLESPEGRQWMPRIERMFEEGKNVPPTRAADLAVALAGGRFDRLAGRSFGVGDDLEAILTREEEILRKDLKTLRFRT